MPIDESKVSLSGNGYQCVANATRALHSARLLQQVEAGDETLLLLEPTAHVSGLVKALSPRARSEIKCAFRKADDGAAEAETAWRTGAVSFLSKKSLAID